MSERQHQSYHEPMRQIAFVLTEKCNLDCIYCYEKNKNIATRTLPAEFVREKIREEMLADNEFRKLWFIFFGGEPLFEFETIRDVVEWCMKENWPSPAKEFHFMVETNGTLLNDAMKQWFTEYHEHVTLSLSLDGTKHAHDLNRCHSYDAVARHLDFFRNNWPDQPVKMTIGPESIDQTCEGVLHIHRLGLNAEFDVLFEDVWGDGESERRYVRIWAEQLQRLVSFYAEHPELQRPAVLNRKLDRLFDGASSTSNTFCGAGKYVICFTPDGLEYPCFRFAPLVVDNPLQDVMNAPNLENEECNRCPFVRICTTCEGHNYAVTGSCFQRTDFHCRFFKVSLLASARLFMLDHPLEQRNTPENESREDKMRRMRRLMGIRLVNDVCSPVVDWAAEGSEH